MDYSSLGPGFGEEEESPFANQPGNLPRNHQNSIFDEHLPDDPHFQPYDPMRDSSQSGGFQDQAFRSPGVGVHSPTSPGMEQNPFGGRDDDRAPQPRQHDPRDEYTQQHQQHHQEQQSSDQLHQQHQQQQHYQQHPFEQQYQSQPHPQSPQQHQPHQQPARYKNQHPPHQRPQPQYRLTAKITGLERTGRKDPILKFDVHTNLPKFRTTQFRDVRRTHPEFQKLAHHLLSSNPECIIPAVPPPSTSAGVGTDEDETRVRAYMQRWLNTICSNPVLIHDEEIIFFIESDFGYSPVIHRKQPATGVRRKVIKQFAPPPDDTPELEAARPVVKAFYLGTMETGQKVQRVVKARRGLGLAEAEFGKNLLLLATPEAHPGLANAFKKLSRTVQSVGDFHAMQATAEATTLADPLNYHSSDAFIVKEILTNRQILMRELDSARKETRSKLQTAEVLKAKSSLRRDKVDEALAALEEAKSAESHLDAKVRRVTNNLLQEQRKWFQRTSADLRAAIRDFTLRQIEAERRTLATLETVRPDIRAIDASGGLSRLGREAPPAARRASLAASQGPKGDAWSGVERAKGVQRGEFGMPREVKETVKRERIVEEEEEGDRLDAKNAASRLAGSTF